jgi:hypothetical protein
MRVSVTSGDPGSVNCPAAAFHATRHSHVEHRRHPSRCSFRLPAGLSTAFGLALALDEQQERSPRLLFLRRTERWGLPQQVAARCGRPSPALRERLAAADRLAAAQSVTPGRPSRVSTGTDLTLSRLESRALMWSRPRPPEAPMDSPTLCPRARLRQTVPAPSSAAGAVLALRQTVELLDRRGQLALALLHVLILGVALIRTERAQHPSTS